MVPRPQSDRYRGETGPHYPAESDEFRRTCRRCARNLFPIYLACKERDGAGRGSPFCSSNLDHSIVRPSRRGGVPALAASELVIPNPRNWYRASSTKPRHCARRTIRCSPTCQQAVQERALVTTTASLSSVGRRAAPHRALDAFRSLRAKAGLPPPAIFGDSAFLLTYFSHTNSVLLFIALRARGPHRRPATGIQ